MKTRSLLTVASLCTALLVPSAVRAKTDDSDRDDDQHKIRRVQVISIADSKGFLGVGVADVDEDRAKDLGLHDDSGVEVKSVVPGSAAAKAGVKKGDVVLEYNGTRVESTTQFIRMVRETRVGKQVRLQVLRDGHTTTLTGTMEKRQPRVIRWKSKNDGGNFYKFETPEPPETPETPDPDDDDVTITIPDMNFQIPDIPTPSMSWKTPRLGVETEALGKQLAEFFGVKDGVLVRSVIRDSAAERAGIKAGDVIVKIGGEDVSRPGDISTVLRSSESSDLPIVVVRNRREMTLTAKIESSAKVHAPKRRSGLFWTPAPTEDPDDDADSYTEDDEDTDD